MKILVCISCILIEAFILQILQKTANIKCNIEQENTHLSQYAFIKHIHSVLWFVQVNDIVIDYTSSKQSLFTMI